MSAIFMRQAVQSYVRTKQPVSNKLTALPERLLHLERWFDTMRGIDGYGGPVVHWWQDCLLYGGVGLDWRYEGIIIGYLELFAKTQAHCWLDKAIRAADDLAYGQLESGNFRASSFELNPYSGGTPHEPACDLALLKLSKWLAILGDDRWSTYLSVAECNLEKYVLARLWNAKQCLLHNNFADASFVPNKAATTVEALFAWHDITRDNGIIEEYGLPILDMIVRAQVNAPGKRIHNAIEQAIRAGKGTGQYFPYYIARCIPALLLGYRHTENPRYLRSAEDAMDFVLRERLPDGSFPQVIYRNGKANVYPRWTAGVGDILRAMHLMQQHGMYLKMEPTLTWLLQGQMPSGAIRTGHGFAFRSSQKDSAVPLDFRDLLPVCGWADKAFRFLAMHTPEVPIGKSLINSAMFETDYQTACTAWGQPATYVETAQEIHVYNKSTGSKQTIYRWHKGSERSESNTIPPSGWR